MLQVMRNMSKSWIFKGLMLLLIVSFGVWGIGDMFRGNPQRSAVAKVGKTVITVGALDMAFKSGLPEARRVLGPDLTEVQARQLGVLDRTLNVMVEQASFDQEAKRLGINVNDRMILDKVAALPQFRDKDGKFNTPLWRQTLNKGGYTERSFLDLEKKDSARRLVFESVRNYVKPPQTMIDNLYRARGGKRILEVLTIHNDSIKDIPTSDDAALQDFHQKNGELFTAPEYRTLTIAKLSADDVTKDIVIDEDELKSAYDTRAAELTLPEQRDLIQVVLQDEEKAKAFAAAVKKSGDLAAAAKAKGLTPVDLDHVDEKNVLPELFTTIFGLDVGQSSEAVKSSLGWHVVQLNKIHPAGKPSFEEIKDILRDTLQREKSADSLARQVNQLDDALAAAHSLEDTADSLKLRLIKIPAIDAKGQTPDGKAPEEFPAKDDVMKIAFGQGAGETSSVIDDRNGNYVVVRTDEVNPQHVEPFDKIREKVVVAWKNDQRAQKAAASAEEIATNLRDGKSATSFAARTGIDVRLSKPISILGESDADLPAKALPQIFQMKKGDVITAADPLNHYVLRLADIIAVDPAKPDATRIKVVEELNDKLPYESLEAYSNFLHKRYPIKINADLMDTLRKQGS